MQEFLLFVHLSLVHIRLFSRTNLRVQEAVRRIQARSRSHVRAPHLWLGILEGSIGGQSRLSLSTVDSSLNHFDPEGRKIGLQ